MGATLTKSNGRHRDDAPPHDLEAERWVLGSIQFGCDLIELLETKQFYSDRHQRIFAALRRLADNGKPLNDPGLLAEELNRSGDLESAGGMAYIAELLGAVPHAANGRHYTDILREHAERRSIIAAAQEAERVARDLSAEIDDLPDRLTPILNHDRRKPRKLVARPYSEYECERIEWAWENRIPRGKLSLFSGDPGDGKTMLAGDVTARESTGEPWPDSPGVRRPPGKVLVFNAEDAPGDTLRPRLERAGGDPSRVLFVEGVAEAARKGQRPKQFNLARDLDELDRLLTETPDITMVTIDPIGAFLGGVDAHRDNEVRSALGPLSEMAARHRVAIVGVAHLNKGGGSRAIYRTLGSVGLPAAARMAWLVGRDRDDADRRLWVPVKCNIVEQPTAMAFRIVGGRVEWEPQPFKLHGDDVLAEAAADRGERSARSEAEVWLRDFLAGGPAVAGDVMKAARSAGISEKALRTAREHICLPPQKEGFGKEGRWYWHLKDAPKDALDAQAQESGTLGIYEGTLGDGATSGEGDKWWT